jgi:glycosyltransferase involved in cell wall biosynthesis
MKIAYFIDHLRPDGAQFVLKQLVEGMSTRGHQQVVFCLNDSCDESVISNLRGLGAKVRIIGKRALFMGYGLVSILHNLRQDHFDVAVTLLFAADIVGRVMGRAARVPRVVTSIQTHDEFYTPFQRWLERRTAHLSDLILINSLQYRDFVIEEEGALPERLRLIYNSIRVSDYQNPVPREVLRAEFGMQSITFVIGTVGRLTYQKGLDNLLQALALLSEDIHLILVGVGEEETRLRLQAASLGLEDRVHFAGYRRDIPDIIGAFDLYIQSSRYEGMPIVVLEAMAAGCPIIATAVDGTRDLIQDGIHGWLVPPDDPTHLAQAITIARNNYSEARRRGSAAKQRAVHQFNQDVILDAWEKAFRGE